MGMFSCHLPHREAETGHKLKLPHSICIKEENNTPYSVDRRSRAICPVYKTFSLPIFFLVDLFPLSSFIKAITCPPK